METFFGVAFAMMVTYFGYRLIRYKGLRDAMFGAEIRKTVGEIEAATFGPVRTMLRVYVLHSENAPEKNIGLEFVAKSFASYQMMPVALSRTQAVNLIALLQQAAGGEITS